MKPSLRGTGKGVLLAIIILSAFIFFMFVTIWSYHLGTETTLSSIVDILLRYHTTLMISMGALGITVGASVFYLMSQKVERTQNTAKKSSETLLRFLSKDEQKVIKQLLENKGKILQSALSRESSMTRLQVHRVLARLSEREVVRLTAYGKTRMVQLDEDIYESLIDK